MGLISFENLVLDNVFLIDGLKHNLISISQLGDMNYKFCFDANSCEVSCSRTNEVKLKGNRVGNVYLTFLESLSFKLESCFVTNISQNTWSWHNRLGYVSLNLINKLVKNDLVNGFLKLKYKRNHICGTCLKGKQINVSFKPMNEVFISKPLKLLHLDLFGPMRTLILGGTQYVLVIVNDYSRFT